MKFGDWVMLIALLWVKWGIPIMLVMAILPVGWWKALVVLALIAFWAMLGSACEQAENGRR
jgi:hypothetical protein